MLRIRTTTLCVTFGLALASMTLLGCGGGDGGHDAGESDAHDDAAHHDEHGPHGGHVIDLGKSHKYHAEIVDSHKTGTITIYILDGDLKETAVDSAEITLTLTASGETRTVTLKGSGEEGKHSQFSVVDAEALEALDADGTIAKLRLTIDGTPYTGTIEHHGH